MAISTEHENLSKGILHNNFSYLLELAQNTNPDVFQQFVKDVANVAAVELNSFCKLNHQPLFR